MRFRPLHPDFGVEVLDFDIERGGSPAEIEELRRAYDEHSMLLFRGAGRLPHERHVELTSWFGPPPPVDNTGQGDFVSVLQNEDAAGSVVLPFHSDLTYTDDPIRAICLQAIELPEKPTSTTYVSNRAAWNCLPCELQDELEGKTLRHVLESSATGMDWPTFIADHPVKFTHPKTGKPLLLVTEYHATRILEMDEDRSREVLDELLAVLYAPQRRYEHVWELNDVLMWDNLVLQHARTEHSDPGRGKRALQRVALSYVTLEETVEIARARQQAA